MNLTPTQSSALKALQGSSPTDVVDPDRELRGVCAALANLGLLRQVLVVVDGGLRLVYQLTDEGRKLA